MRSAPLKAFLFRAFSWILLVLSGCSGASAPPVSLPAPVIGRITVTSPDEDGVSLVVGDEEAVTGGSLVHAVNDSAGGSTLRAQSLPAICSRAFHGCAFAEDDGSFEIEIQASVDHQITVEILDRSSETALSDRTTKPVPRNIRHFARPVVDVGVLPASQKLYAVMASNADNPNGLVSVLNLSDNTRNAVTFDGATPARLMIHPGTSTAAVVEVGEGSVALVDLTNDNFDAPDQVDVPAPRDVVFSTDGSTLFVSTAAPGAVLRSINVASSALSGLIDNDDLDPFLAGAINDATRGLDLIAFDPGVGPAVDLLAFVGLYTVSGTSRPALGLVAADSLTLLGLTALPDGTDPNDVAFLQTEDRILVTDTGNDEILVYRFTTGLPDVQTATLTLEGSVDDPDGVVVNPRRIVVDPAGGVALVTAKNGTTTRPDTVLTIDLTALSVTDINPVGLNPTGIAYDAAHETAYIATAKTRAVTSWSLTDLLP